MILVSSGFGEKKIEPIPTQSYVYLANQITVDTTKIIQKKYGLTPFGSGGSMMDDVKLMALSFACYHKLTIDEARKLIVHCTEEYLKQINQNSKIRPYLHNVPFTDNNIKLVIFCYKPNRKRVDPGQICVAGIMKGKIAYKSPTPDDKRVVLLEETFEDAVKIIEKQQNK